MIRRSLDRFQFGLDVLRLNAIPREYLRHRLIYCDPLQIKQLLIPKILKRSNRRLSGYVTSRDIFSGNTIPLRLHPKIRYCFAHFDSKLTWRESLVYDYYSSLLINNIRIDKIWDVSDLEERLKALDLLFENVANSGQLKTRFELGFSSQRFEEQGGIYVHFDGAGQPIFGGGGFHRLAIAQIVGLHRIPVCLGLVHKDFEKNLVEKIKQSNLGST